MQLNRQIIIILILASLLISALATAFYFYNKNKQALKSNNELVTIYVAKDDIKRNTLIKPEHMGRTKIAKKFLLNRPLNKKEILGKYTKEPIYKNEMFIKQKLNTQIEKRKAKVLDFSKSSYNMRFDLFNNPNYSLNQGDYINIISVYPSGEPNRQGNYSNYDVQYVANNIKVLGFIKSGKLESASIVKEKVKKLRNKKVVEEVVDVKANEIVIDINPEVLLKLIKDYNKGNQLWMVKTKESIQIDTIDKMNKKQIENLIKKEESNKKEVKKEQSYKLYKPKDYTINKKAIIDYINIEQKNKKIEKVEVKVEPKNICKNRNSKYIVGNVSSFYIRNSPSLNSNYKRVLSKNTIIPFFKKQNGWFKTCDNLFVSQKVAKAVSKNFVRNKLGFSQ
ncbi:MAG: hypothetical protein ACQERD_01935 [Campylobacterota bacterium]